MRQIVLLLLICPVTSFASGKLCVREMTVPTYPHLARSARLQGTVTLQVQVGSDGKVISARGAGAHPLLVREAEKNIRQWEFDVGAGVNDFPLEQTVTFTYTLKGREMYRPPPPVVVLHLPNRVEITTYPPEPQP